MERGVKISPISICELTKFACSTLRKTSLHSCKSEKGALGVKAYQMKEANFQHKVSEHTASRPLLRRLHSQQEVLDQAQSLHSLLSQSFIT